MKRTRWHGRARVALDPGEHHVAMGDIVLSTILGSCVSVCMFDPVRKLVGMNHFLLSNNRYSKSMPYYQTEAGRYGVHSMEILINRMINHGASRENLRAKAFGGASMFRNEEEAGGNFFCVGQVNAQFVRDFLKNEGIPLLTSDLGGASGRLIFFFSNDYSVYLRRLRAGSEIRIGSKEKDFWQRTIKQKEEEPPSVDLWAD